MKNLVPRTPLGPSDTRIAGIPSLGTAAVCQKSVPDKSDTFSSMLSCSNTSSTSKSLCVVFGAEPMTDDRLLLRASIILEEDVRMVNYTSTAAMFFKDQHGQRAITSNVTALHIKWTRTRTGHQGGRPVKLRVYDS